MHYEQLGGWYDPHGYGPGCVKEGLKSAQEDASIYKFVAGDGERRKDLKCLTCLMLFVVCAM